MPKQVSHQTIRILSDLHIGHKASLIRDVDHLQPLIEGSDVVIFNGDTLELKYGTPKGKDGRPHIAPDDFAALIRSWGAEPIFITGNHDPAISEHHFVSLNGGQIMLTHGDGIFKEITPWSSESKDLSTAREKLEATYHSEVDLRRYLQTVKDASIEAHKLRTDYDPTLLGRIAVFFHQAWPPNRPFKILSAWSETPAKSVALARRFGLEPSLILVGHTHKPTIAKVDNTHVVNTGSFFPWPGAFAVDLDRSGTTIRKIEKRKNSFSLGSEVARLPYVFQSIDNALPRQTART